MITLDPSVHRKTNPMMMMNTTLEQLRGLKLNGMAAGLHDQLSITGMNGLSFEERMALLVEREVHWRSDKKRERLMKEARLKSRRRPLKTWIPAAGAALTARHS